MTVDRGQPHDEEHVEVMQNQASDDDAVIEQPGTTGVRKDAPPPVRRNGVRQPASAAGVRDNTPPPARRRGVRQPAAAAGVRDDMPPQVRRSGVRQPATAAGVRDDTLRPVRRRGVRQPAAAAGVRDDTPPLIRRSGVRQPAAAAGMRDDTPPPVRRRGVHQPAADPALNRARIPALRATNQRGEQPQLLERRKRPSARDNVVPNQRARFELTNENENDFYDVMSEVEYDVSYVSSTSDLESDNHINYSKFEDGPRRSNNRRLQSTALVEMRENKNFHQPPSKSQRILRLLQDFL